MKGFVYLAGAGLLLGVLAFTSDQASRGGAVFQRSCAVCHGPQAGGGTVPERFEKLAGRTAPALAGPQALSRFADGGELFGYVRRQMPLNDPGSLTDQTYVDVVAWLLQQHGLAPDGRPLTPEGAGKIPLRHDRK